MKSGHFTIIRKSLRAIRHFALICWMLTLVLLPLASSAAGLSTFTDSEETEILPPEKAFKLSVIALDAQTLSADFTITPGHYLYRERIKFEVQPANNKVVEVVLPKGDLKQDPNFGETEVYHQSFSAEIKLAAAAAGSITVLASYQGCSEKGLCYAPISKAFVIDLPTSDNNTQRATTVAGDQTGWLLKDGRLWLIIAGLFGLGLLLVVLRR